jgi:hypothetical protein
MFDVRFVFNDRCSANSIIAFVRTQEHLTEAQRLRLCGEILLDYLHWVGDNCGCVSGFRFPRIEFVVTSYDERNTR